MLKTASTSIILFLTFLSCFSQSQQVADSIRPIISAEQDENRKVLLLHEYLMHEQRPDSSIIYASQYIDLCLKLNLTDRLTYGYNDLARGYHELDQLEKALENFHLSLKYATKDVDIASTYADMASTYQHNEDFRNSTRYYRKAIDVFNRLADSLRIGTTYISLGYAYYLQNELDSASHFLVQSTQIFNTLKIKYQDYYWAYAEGNYALVLAKQGRVSESEDRLTEVIEVLEKYKDYYAISEYKLELAKVYALTKDPDHALELAHEGLQLALDGGYKKFIRNGSQILSEFYMQRGDFKKAYEYQVQFMAYNDSLINADLVRQLASQRTAFEVGQKQAEVDLLTAEKRNQQIVLYATTGFAVLLFGLAGVIFLFYRSKSRTNLILAEQKAELEALNQTKNRFFSIISHDLRGPVSSFHGVARLMKTLVEANDQESLNLFADEMDKSVSQLSDLLDNLLTWAMQQQGNFSANPQKLEASQMVEEVIGSLQNMAKGKSIQLSMDVEQELCLWVDKNTTVTIVRNLVNNALKFTPQGGSVMVKGTKAGNLAKIQVVDTGVGMPQEKLENLFVLNANKSSFGTKGEKGLGLGLQLVQDFVQMNGGSLLAESTEGEGTTFTVLLPLAD